MQLLAVEIEDEKMVDIIFKILNSFKKDGVNVRKIIDSNADNNEEWDEKLIKSNWKEIGMNTHSADLDDDERLYEAAARFYNEKYSD